MLKNLRYGKAVERAESATCPRLSEARPAPALVGETGDRGAEMCLRRVPELHDERMVLERLLDDAALNTFAASVNQPHLAQAGFVRGADVLDDDRCDVARRERMEIDRVFDWDFMSIPNSQNPTPNHSQFRLPIPNNAQGWELGVGSGWKLELGVGNLRDAS